MVDADDIPDTCQTAGCESEPRHYIRYTEPEELVFYCEDHIGKHRSDPKALRIESFTA